MSVSLQDNGGSVQIQGLLHSHRTPWVELSVGEEDVVYVGNEAVVPVVRG